MSKIISFLFVVLSGSVFISNTSINLRPSIEFVNFISSHPEKVSSCLSQNGEIIFSYNSNKNLPVSSTTKILVAAALAEQVTLGKIDLEESIPIQKITNLYLPSERSVAFDSWLKKRKSVQLSKLVRAMIKYNSNAIEEYLIGKIGLEKINNIIGILNLESHSKITPPVSLQLAMNNKKVSSQNRQSIIQEALTIHKEVATESLFPSKLNLKSNEHLVEESLQPEATTKEYTILLDNILGYQNLNDDIIDLMIPFLIDVTYDENGSEVYREQPSVILSFGSQDFYNVILYNKEASSDERFVSSYFFEGLNKKEIGLLESNIDDLVSNIRAEDNLNEVIKDLTNIAFD